jgi:uncharacterized membrane protein YfcA
MQVLVYIGIGLVVGTISGLMGIAGGVILVPLLTWLCGFELRKASGTSLAILAIPVTLPGALKAYRADHVEVEPILWIAGAFVVSSIVSRHFIEFVPELVLRRLFGLLLVYIAFRFLMASDSEAANAFVGLTAVVGAWLIFILLRGLGRQKLVRPELGSEIQRAHDEGRGDPDYYI